MARIQDYTQSASVACATKTGGIEKIWIIDNNDVTSMVVTETTTTAVISAITLSGANKAFTHTFTDDNTAFANQVQANAREAIDLTVFIGNDGITDEGIDQLNGLNLACGVTVIIKFKSGKIFVYGRDYNYTTNVNAHISTTLKLKGQILSGLGNNDSERIVYEFVGQAKAFQLTTSMSEAALDAL